MLLGARQFFSSNTEEQMYKQILDAMIRNTNGAEIDLSRIFPFDGPSLSFGTSGYLANGQIFRYNKFLNINMGNLNLTNSYGFSSSTLRTVTCGLIGNNSTIFAGCTALADVYAKIQTSTNLLTKTAIFNSTPSDVNKNIVWHCGADGKKITWNSEISQWVVADDN